MTDDKKPLKDIATEEAPSAVTTDWEELRAEAAKRGITLSELQQERRQRKLRQKAKEDIR